MKVYVVEDNEPYEYDMLGIFSSYDRAREYIDNQIYRGTLQIREVELDIVKE